MKYAPLLILLVASLTISACDSADPEEEIQDPTFSAVQGIFNTSCDNAGCHSGASPRAGLDLTSGAAFAEIVGVTSTQDPSLNLVDANDPDNSYLVRKIEGNPAAGTNRMPPNGSALSATQIDLVRSWISEGAMNN